MKLSFPCRLKQCAAITMFWLIATTCLAQAPITVSVGPAEGPPIPDDFAGLSFESSNLSPDKNGQWLFSAEDKPLIDLFRAIGIRNLRVGGGTADGPEFRIPGPADIDHLFAFAQAAHVRVIYTLRLLNGDMDQDAMLAKYIQKHYSSQLVCFEIGNEPDWHSFHTAPDHPRDSRIVEAIPGEPGSAYPSYLEDWRKFAAKITAAAPGAVFTGPDTGSDYPVPGTKNTDYAGESWTQRFAHDEKGLVNLAFVTQHDYPGQSATGVSIPTAIDSMLSPQWISSRYDVLWRHVLAPLAKEGVTYRMTEANDYTGGVDGASNAFASALWALDYLHWHAAHHAAGVNFHNKSWIFTDTVFRRPDGAFGFNPKAYGIEAFDLGSHGRPAPVAMTNEDHVNLTAYAVRGEDALYITLINKEHGARKQAAEVTITAKAIRAQNMSLEAPNSDVTAREGITLGGASISPQGWHARWTDLPVPSHGKTAVNVPATSAVVVKLTLDSK